tara:strand:- start:472 stop:1071 length:600 start_codon:yes stop_codon:yes gene_type:complete
MTVTVIDDRFDDLFIHEFYKRVNEIPVTQNNVANRYTWPYGTKGTHRLQGAQIFARETLNRFSEQLENVEVFFDVFDVIQKVVNRKFYMHSIHLNIQHKGADGAAHVDADNPDDLTIMMMPNPVWKPDWGGKFELMNMDGTEVAESIDYVPGRVIIFPGHIPHRGMGPSVDGVYRSTIVWRVTPLEVYVNRLTRCQAPI